MSETAQQQQKPAQMPAGQMAIIMQAQASMLSEGVQREAMLRAQVLNLQQEIARLNEAADHSKDAVTTAP